MKHKLLSLILLLIISACCNTIVINAQTVVFDEEIYWEWDIPQDYGGYSFYWWHRTDKSGMFNLGDMPTNDWVSPNNYYTGEFRMRFEVISQPSNEPFYIQFGIWQDSYKGSNHPETVCSRQAVSPGSVFEGSLGSPYTWWNKEPEDPVDFSRPEDFYRVGIVLWNQSPLCIPMGTSWSSSGCPENAYKFFPMRARVTITAYPGSGGPVINPPNYSVDFYNERTSKVVATEDQYSYDNFSGGTVYNGDGSYLSLTPGQDVYFRKKADYTKKQTLDVPSRPSAPSFGIDYVAERTAETVSSAYEYSSESNMGNAQTGSGTYIDLVPGEGVYFRQKATSSSFRSNIQSLEVPERPPAPEFQIDYLNERTTSVIGEEYEYSYDQEMIDVISGNNDYLTVIPGNNLYFRQKATLSSFLSDLQSLIVPNRPEVPDFIIDFANEETLTGIGSDYLYASDISMSDAVTGDGSRLQVVPGTELCIQKKSTDSTFRSGIQLIILPERPEAPLITIDYDNESTVGIITGELEYSPLDTFVPSDTGAGQPLGINPGDKLYFRKLATDDNFSSEILELQAPFRPVITFSGADTISQNPFIVSIIFYQQVSDLESEDFTVINADLSNLGLASSSGDSVVYEALFNSITEGPVSLQLNANAITGGNFQSELLELYLIDSATDHDQTDIGDAYLFIYPNPSSGIVQVSSFIDSSYQQLTLEVFSLTGNLLYEEKIDQGNEHQLNLELLSSGIYVLKIKSPEYSIANKLIIQK